jgi:hypothetical protein
VQNARHVYLTGIGSSWRAALTAAPLFSQRGCPVYMQDAAELLQFSTIPSGAVIVAISRRHRNRQSIGIPPITVAPHSRALNQLGGWAQPQKIAARTELRRVNQLSAKCLRQATF